MGFRQRIFFTVISFFTLTAAFAQSISSEAEMTMYNGNFSIENGEIYYIYHKGKTSELHTIKLGQKEIKRTKLPAIFEYIDDVVIEDGYIYGASTHYAHKMSLGDFTEVWKAPTDSKMMPQCIPQMYGDLITFAYDDRIFVINKNSGKIEHTVKGSNLECDVSIVDNKLIYSKFNGTVSCVDLNSNKKLWSKDVGESSGFGVTKDGNDVILPSWSAQLFKVDLNTGKETWKIDMEEVKNGCGSGFEEAPVIVGDNFFAPHRDEGFFAFNKDSGELVENIELGSEHSVYGGSYLYKGIIWFASDKALFGYDPDSHTLTYNLTLPSEYTDDPVVSDNWFTMHRKDSKSKKDYLIQIDLDGVIGN